MSSSSQIFSCIPKLLAMTLAFAVVFYVLNPAFYWQLAKAAVRGNKHCNPCLCDCMLETKESMLLPGFGNSVSSDCDDEQHQQLQQEEVDQKSIDLLREELKLHETVALQTQHQSDSALLDAKKLISQYQKEAEKCSSGMETCEVAREKSEAALSAQKKISAMWERRAREQGWRDKPSAHSNFFDRIGLSGVASTDAKSDSFPFRKARKA